MGRYFEGTARVITSREFHNVRLVGIENCMFHECNFLSCVIEGVISSCVFEYCDMTKVDFSDVIISGTDWYNCFVEDSTFIGSKFKECVFEESDVVSNSFAKSMWDSVDFVSCYFGDNGLVDLYPLKVTGLDIKRYVLDSGDVIVHEIKQDRVYHKLFAGIRYEVLMLLKSKSRMLSDEVRMSLFYFLQDLGRRN